MDISHSTLIFNVECEIFYILYRDILHSTFCKIVQNIYRISMQNIRISMQNIYAFYILQNRELIHMRCGVQPDSAGLIFRIMHCAFAGMEPGMLARRSGAMCPNDRCLCLWVGGLNSLRDITLYVCHDSKRSGEMLTNDR